MRESFSPVKGMLERYVDVSHWSMYETLQTWQLLTIHHPLQSCIKFLNDILYVGVQVDNVYQKSDTLTTIHSYTRSTQLSE